MTGETLGTLLLGFEIGLAVGLFVHPEIGRAMIAILWQLDQDAKRKGRE